ncbi:radical SAM/SPASM domain-containing protein [Desulfobacula toluolica]|uniref:Radical SAM domain protein n=1 Tax=Desulfobacula toluolica (strain DSM 7467 / Tol2) TaxID=651182 RepID=K0NPD0_DESTT|nr:SPASM domain-containing protein [Desulfobacula toluolica]CCK81993.1 radical SAM domain protein [Desulfobacula toluolica Tol2]
MNNNIINSIEIDLGGSCNLNCFFCYLTKVKTSDKFNKNKLLLDEIIDLINQANELGVQKVILFNNSSNQHPDTAEILKLINKKNMQMEFSLTKPCNNLSVNENALIKCLKHKDSCFINLYGSVYPCAGMRLSIGNIRQNRLKKILFDSEVLANLKNHEFSIKGPCRKCDKFSNCYGCRARTFALTGDYLASDPLCPENQDKLEKITYLPMSVEKLVPQKQGMRVVTNLLTVKERYAKVESIFPANSPFIKKDGSLEEFAYMEVMAQSAGVMDGFEKFDTGKLSPGGFLIGGQKINIYAKTFAGDKLIIDIYKTTKFGNFGILTAKIYCKDILIAEGEVKIYQTDGVNNEI